MYLGYFMPFTLAGAIMVGSEDEETRGSTTPLTSGHHASAGQ